MASACFIDLDELVVLALGVRCLVALLDEEDDAFLIGVVPLLLKLTAGCDLRHLSHRLHHGQRFWPLLQLWEHPHVAHDVEDGSLIASTVAVEERFAVTAIADGE